MSRAIVDDALFDESRYLIDILRELEIIDIRLLLALESTIRSQDTVDRCTVLGVSVGVAESLNAKLVRLGLAETPGRLYRGLHRQVRASPFGVEVLNMLRQYGDGDPLT